MGNKKVLVVDDDLGILEVVKIVLEESGFIVKTISDPKNIINDISAFGPDLVLMDIWMSGFDGIDVTKKIKSISMFKNIPVVIISAKTDSELAKAKGVADDYIAKPFDIEDLLERVNKLIS